ncbi:MAG: antibiotic transport system ATP-binding protein [Gallionellaceae bacterium]|nr:MAG: antibiotic transport system ATP-binding protein [Gallionellaceae bacterium]
MFPAVDVLGVRKHYGKLCALDNVDLRIEQGEFFGLLGPNGAGKTTLINLLSGLSKPDTGRVSVMGYDVVRQYRDSRRLMGVVPQELVFDPFFNVRETLRFQSGYFGVKHNEAWIDEVMHHLDLSDKADTNMRRLSGGMKRRVLVAQALVHKPPVIVLDEPTAGVDVELRRSLWRFIRRLNLDGHTVLAGQHAELARQRLRVPGAAALVRRTSRHAGGAKGGARWRRIPAGAAVIHGAGDGAGTIARGRIGRAGNERAAARSGRGVSARGGQTYKLTSVANQK